MQPAVAGGGEGGHQHPHPPHLPPWMPPPPLQFPPAHAMVMQHHCMMAAQPHFSPQHYVQFHPHFPKGQPPQPLPPPAASEDNKTIWVGDLLYWMDENYLHSCFKHSGDVNSIKVIRNKQTGQSEGYGFVEFSSHATAQKALQNLSGTQMPHTELCFRLNWASFGMGDRRQDVGSDFSIFVGDLASDVTDNLLQETFGSKYSSVKGARVVIDPNTGRSKGYGFVRFGDESEKTRAMTEMSGVYCSSRAMRIGAATPRKLSGGYGSNGQGQSDGDTSNTTVFVGGLDPNASEDDLRQAFSKFGEIASVKIPLGKQCGFVHFVNRNNAEEALQKLNGAVIGSQTVRLSWGRNPANKQARADPGSQWHNNGYYGAPFYNGYGYTAAPPGMYAFACSPYPMYGSQQQVS